MPFFKKKKTTFKTGKLDVFVVTVVFIVFIWAMFFGSFKVATDENGEIIYVNTYTVRRIPNEEGDLVYTHRRPMIEINLQFFIAPIILVYEALLLRLEGKKRGRYLPWALYYQIFRHHVRLKMIDGKNQTIEWWNNRK